MNVDMFSTMPSTGTLTRRNMAMPRRASINARSCGVETMTAPRSGTCCAMVSCASPVPGGMSTTMTSSVPHSTSRSIWVSADITIGPRQIIGVSSSIRNPIDMTAMPWRTIGFKPGAADGLRPLADGEELRHRRPVNVGIENADFEPEIAQAEREIDRGGRFADAAFAGRDRNDRSDARNPGRAAQAACAGAVARLRAACARLRALRQPDAPARRRRRPPRSAVSATMTELTPGTRAHRFFGALAHRFPTASPQRHQP